MRVYIETSVPNMLLHDDAPEKQRITKARSPRRERLESAVVAFRAMVLAVTAEAELLAGRYAAARIIPAKFQDDLLHVAVAVCHRLDMIVSWNMEHLANSTKVARILILLPFLDLSPERRQARRLPYNPDDSERRETEVLTWHAFRDDNDSGVGGGVKMRPRHFAAQCKLRPDLGVGVNVAIQFGTRPN